MKALLSEHEFKIWLIRQEGEEQKKAINKQIANAQRLLRLLESAVKNNPLLESLIGETRTTITGLQGLLPGVDRDTKDRLGTVLAPSDIGGGIKKGLKEVREELADESKIWLEMTKNVASSMMSTFSDLFFDAMRGELISLGDVWSAFSQAVQREIANMAAQWVTSGLFGTDNKGSLIAKGFSLLGDLLGGGAVTPADTGVYTAHSGGLITVGGSGGIKRMHNGGLNSNEQLRIVKDGEYEIKDSSVRSLGIANLNAMNRTGQMPAQQRSVVSNTYNAYVQAVDAQSLDTLLRERGGRAIRDIALGSYSVGKRRGDPRTR